MSSCVLRIRRISHFLMTSVDLLHCTSGSIIHPESILGVSLWKIYVRNLFPSAITNAPLKLAEVDKMLEQMYKMLGCTLTTIPGVNVITAVKILAEIGDIKRFSNANKLAQFAGIAPLHLSSSGKGKDVATKQGNRRLQVTIYFLAIQMVQLSSKGTPRNPVVRAYYEKRKAEGKTSQQALICISRRLISIIYGM